MSDSTETTTTDAGHSTEEVLNGLPPELHDLAKLQQEPFHPDLLPYVRDDATFGTIVHHPLVIDILGVVPGLTNLQYIQKIKDLDKALAEEDWHRVVFLHERPYRTDAFIDHVLGRLDPDDPDSPPRPLIGASTVAREIAAELWTDSENIHEHVDDWLAMLDGWEPGMPLIFGDEEECEAFESLPEVIEVWRGDLDDGGFSWSTDRTVGEFFARRFGRHRLLHGTVEKRKVFGYLTRRGESEIMVHAGEVEFEEVEFDAEG